MGALVIVDDVWLRRRETHFIGRESQRAVRAAGLGDTGGMTCKELSEKTLVTKGTLTGVLDRLERKGLVARVPSREDRRSIFIRLTPKGDALFLKVFPTHINYMRPYFERALTTAEANTLRELLLRLKSSFERD